MTVTYKEMAAVLGLIVAILLAYQAGYQMAWSQARGAIMAGPSSDNYGPALRAISAAREKLRGDDQEARAELDKAQAQIEQAQRCTKTFLAKRR
ncbi:hypothetical protein [Armatimonas sp.]|uniref:hypothetical protein n=1 Tax=Armatimonas sp. TaxID=1872638 RepID=UPI00286B0B43|nr:hypothetical protein [Armatimonas sp.]